MATTFNAGQISVLESEARRTVVTAGAGSGKTSVLAELFVRTVLALEGAGEADPMGSVLLITFTDKAAGELVERVRRTLIARGRADLARQVDSAWISTIHGFCARIVRRHALELGVDPAFSVLAETDAGIQSTAAFERAAASLIDDADVRELLDEWGAASLRSSVMEGYETMRSKGLDVADVRPSQTADVARILERTAEDLGGLVDEYRSLPETATVSSNLAIYRTVLDGLGRMLPALRGAQAGSVPSELRAPLAGLLAAKGKKIGGAEMKELTEAANESIATGAQAVRDAGAARWSRAWCALLDAFDREYAQAKTALQALDFEDLQLQARRLWRESPQAAQRYTERFALVLNDECQDTNRLQLDVIEPIAGRRSCLVGDFQQSIYAFRGADAPLFAAEIDRAEADPDGAVCRLTVNYRSHPGILACVNDIFRAPELLGAGFQALEHELDRPTGVTWPDGEPRVEVIVADKKSWKGEWRRAEAAAVAGRLRELVADGCATAGDIVVLCRAATTMGEYVDALEAEGFEVSAPAAGGFYATRELADARALLRVLANPLDAEGTIGLLAGGLGGLSDDALLLLALRGAGSSVWEALSEGDAPLPPDDLVRADLVRATVTELRSVLGRIRLADAILHGASVLAPGGGGLARAGAWGNYSKVARLAAEYEATGASDPGGFLRYLDEREAYVTKEAVGGAAAECEDAVRVMTVHAAKGLEFPVVALVDLGHAPHDVKSPVILEASGNGLVAAMRGPRESEDEAGAGSTEWQAARAASQERSDAEDARVLYVGCTRAEQVLLLGGSADLEKLGSGRTAIDRIWRAIPAGSTGDVTVSFVRAPEGEADGRAPSDATAERGGTPYVSATAERGGTPHVSATAAPAAAAPTTGLPSPLPPEPLPVPSPIAPPREMSYTAFALHQACAYRFYAERMLRVGSLSVQKEHDPLAFGSALHAALELIARGEQPDDARLRAIARGARLADAETGRLASAVSTVTASPVRALLEAGRPEVDFALPVAAGVVRGSMDLLVTEGNAATVLDYKTGATFDSAGGRYAEQAEVYALALLEAGFDRVAVRFIHVEAGCEEASFAFTPPDAPAIRRKLEDAWARMSSGEFPRLAAFDERLCPDCPVSGGLCPVVHPGRKPKARASAR